MNYEPNMTITDRQLSYISHNLEHNIKRYYKEELPLTYNWYMAISNDKEGKVGNYRVYNTIERLRVLSKQEASDLIALLIEANNEKTDYKTLDQEINKILLTI